MTEEIVSNEDLYEIDSLIEDGKFEEALRKHLWFHEVSRESPGMGGVRLSYAIESWLNLAGKYPPAMESLTELKDNNKKVLLAGSGSFDNFHDFSAINHYLNKEDDTYNTFLTIHEKIPGQAKRYFHVVEDMLVENGRFDICEVYIDDPVRKYKHIEKLHKMNVEISKSGNLKNDEEFEQYAQEKYTKSVCQLIKILVAIGNTEAAKNIKKLALSYSDNKCIDGAI